MMYCIKRIITSLFFLAPFFSAYAQSADDFFIKGGKYADSSNHSMALLYYTRAIQLNPYDWRFYQKRAWTSHLLKDNKNAIEDLNKCLDLKPKHENKSAVYLRGKILLEDGQYSASIEDWTYIIDYFPKEFEAKIGIAHYFRGRALLYLNKKDSACLDFNEASIRGMADAKPFIDKYCIK